MIISYTSKVVNCIALADLMKSKCKWSLSKLQFPSSFHLCITAANCKNWTQFVKDVNECVETLKKDSSLNHTHEAVVYGTTEAVPDKHFLN